MRKTRTLINLVFFMLPLMLPLTLWGQAKLAVKVTEAETGGPVLGAAVIFVGTEPLVGGITDADGRVTLEAKPGSYNVRVTGLGYLAQERFNVIIANGNVQAITLELPSDANRQAEVEIVQDRRRSAVAATIETPISVQRLTTEEIKSNPGGNFDISKVIQALPGVAGSTGTASFRNDIIIRGGAPNENVYYLDGIEVPVINHFQTQGGGGGPAGIINVSFIEDVTLSTSAFHSRYDNALASVFQFKQKDGNPERIQGNLRTSSSEVALTLEGPIDKKTTFLVSARRSYLQFLFAALDFPIRPNYWDFQTKITRKLSDKTTLSVLGIGAIDEFSFATPKKSDPNKEYAIRSSPTVNQWNYTAGAVLKHQLERGFWQLAASRTAFDNKLDRFENRQDNDPSARRVGIRSRETDNRLRFEYNTTNNGWKLTTGASFQVSQFFNNVFLVIQKPITDAQGGLIQPGITINTTTQFNFLRYGAFAQLSRSFLDNRLGVSAGVRTDINTFMTRGKNPIDALAPRISASYALTETWRINASVGRYSKLPIYTVLGFKDQNGTFVNKDNKYLTADHYVAGFEYLPTESTRITVEGFYKVYKNYPFSERDGISLANQGVTFSALGNERTIGNGRGRTQGIEVFFQQKLVKKTFATLSYTFVSSRFSGATGELVPSAWDNRHLISTILGQKLPRNWELGLKYRLAGGPPFTPFNEEASRRNFLTTGQGTLDNTAINTRRLGAFNQVDFRIDKKINYNKVTLDIYLDIQNALFLSNPEPDTYTFKRTEDGKDFVTTDNLPLATDGSNAIPIRLINVSDTFLPSFGFIVEF